MNRAEKNSQIEDLHSRLVAAGSAFLIDMTGMKVNEVTDLRRKIKATSGSCKVVKNRLAARAAKGTGAESLVGRFKGPIGLVTHPTDPVVLAKVLEDFGKDNPKLAVRAAAVDGKLAEPAEVKILATLPGLPELRATLLGTFNAPASTLVRLLNTPGSQLARALDERRKQLEG